MKQVLCFLFAIVATASGAQAQQSRSVADPPKLVDVKFSPEEQRIIADALSAKEDGALRLVSLAKAHIVSEQSITLVDAIVIHGALMTAHDARATPVIWKIRGILNAQNTEAR
jgi:hypothetical protein